MSAPWPSFRPLLRLFGVASVLCIPDGFKHVLERAALVARLDRHLWPAVTSIQDHSRRGELHCRWDRVVVHDRENLVERGRRALTRKVNQFSFLPREAASVRRSTATQPTPISVSLRREDFDRASHVSHVPLFARVAQAARMRFRVERLSTRRRSDQVNVAALEKVRRGKVQQVGQAGCRTTTLYRGVGCGAAQREAESQVRHSQPVGWVRTGELHRIRWPGYPARRWKTLPTP